MLAIVPEFLIYQLLSRGSRADRARCKGFQRDNAKDLQGHIKSWRILCPPSGEQQRIVDHIDVNCAPVNTAISRLEREIELIREYRTRFVADVVTGKLDVRQAAARVPDEAPLDTIVDDDDLNFDPEVADDELSEVDAQ